MNFRLTVIGLHVCYNQEILANIAADHRQRCVIYKRLFIFSLGVGGGGVWCNLVYPPETLGFCFQTGMHQGGVFLMEWQI